MNPSTLNHHLKALMKAGLVENHYRKIEGKEDYSFYQLTELGREFLRRIGAL
jgi:DNA-binding PadR family transcriptional regulator